jgi:hypothetical protein
MKKRILIQKEVFVDEIENEEGKLEEIMDDICDNDVIYYINQENPPGCDTTKQFEVRAVLAPVGFDLSNFSEIVYQTKMSEGGICPLPLHLLNKLNIQLGDSLYIEEHGNGVIIKKQNDT